MAKLSVSLARMAAGLMPSYCWASVVGCHRGFELRLPALARRFGRRAEFCGELAQLGRVLPARR